MTAERFAEIKNRAKRIIDMDVNGQLDGIKKKAVSEGRMTYTTDGEVDTNIMSAQNIQENRTRSEIQEYSAPQQQFSSTSLQNSKLPKEIIESMVNNPIDTTMLEMPGVTTSILDQMDYLTNGKILQNEKKQAPTRTKKVVTEQVSQVQPSSNNVDYSLIRTIVEDCVKKYTTALKKSVLTENKGSSDGSELQAMKIGNKFSFITKNGDLYEAQLKFIKNINEGK